jgi:hypothetical protein
MARSRNDRIRRRIGKAIINGTLSSAGTITAAGVGTTLHASFDSSGALLNSDSAGYADGSLHYLSKLKKMYVWDDSDGQFFELTGLDSAAAAGTSSYSFQGSAFGYAAGAQAGNEFRNTIEKFSLSADANATDVGDLVQAQGRSQGCTSSDHGYVVAAFNPNITFAANSTIQRFPFSTDTNSTGVGDLAAAALRYAGSSNSKETHGYSVASSGPPTLISRRDINKFPFASSTSSTDVGDVTVNRERGAGGNSSTHGYKAGGSGAPISTIIDKFPFASDGNATDVGDLLYSAGANFAGASSTTHGYTAGGFPAPTGQSINKYSFSTDGNATDVGDLITSANGNSGSSSTTHGYSAGGGPAVKNTIQKFPFSTDANATDIADLTATTGNTAGDIQV